MSWPLVKLGDVATVINGRAYNKDELLPAGKYPVLRVGNFFSNRDWYYSDLELDAKNYCDTGDLLYAWSASFGPKIWDEGKVIYHYHIWKLVLNEDKVDKKYLFYFLQRDVGKIKQEHGAGSTMIHITKGAMEERLISLPPLEEQKRIAAILDKADAIRRKRQQAIKLADDFLRSVFLEMFGDPVTNPKGWEVRPVGEVSDCIVPGRDKPKSFTGSTPWVTTNDLNHLGFTHCSKSNIGLSEEEIKNVRARVVPKSSVLMTCVGDLGVVSISANDMVINQQLHAFLPSEKYASTYLAYALSFQKGYMTSMASSTTLPYMNKTICNGVPVMVPSLSLQIKFEKIFMHVNELKNKLQRQEFNPLFNSLSQKAFSGEL